MPNVHFIHSNAQNVLDNLPTDFVSQFLIFFPSPFPISRRIFNNSLYQNILRTAKTNCKLKIVTDNKEYYNLILNMFDNKNWISAIWTPLNHIKSPYLFINTACEKKYGAKYLLEYYKL